MYWLRLVVTYERMPVQGHPSGRRRLHAQGSLCSMSTDPRLGTISTRLRPTVDNRDNVKRRLLNGHSVRERPSRRRNAGARLVSESR